MVKVIGISSSGLEPDDAQRYGITIVPLRVNFGDETLRDGVDISKEAFLQRLAASKVFPTTSQPPRVISWSCTSNFAPGVMTYCASCCPIS